jgi:cytochrome c553
MLSGMPRIVAISIFLGLPLLHIVHAATPTEVEFFEAKVRPVLAEHCYKCHGAEKQKAELRLDSRVAILKGSDAGPVVVPGKPEESLLIKSVRHEGDSKMPEKEEKLPDSQIEALTAWVKMGLPWPDADAARLTKQEEAARTHWSFQPVKDPAPPQTRDAAHWARSPIDQFILAQLEAAGLEPAPLADRRTLIRRATFDLIGLPPTFDEVRAFESDDAPDAFARLIDRLLASPHYGERWGRFWLDVARYADTKGYVFQEERRYPFAYTYRDWVVRALNEDMPYDQFLVRQIAADHLKEGPESLAALGFLTLGRRFINNIHDIIDDRIDVVSRGTMALTTTCARCHDHKFDPISQKDYYALYGVFASSTEPDLKDLPRLPGEDETPEYAAERRKGEVAIRAYYARRALELGAIVTAAHGGTPIFFTTEAIEALFQERGFYNRKARDEVRELKNKLARVETNSTAPPRAMALVDKPVPVTPHVFLRGSPDRPGDEVPRRFLTVLSHGKPEPFTEGSGRLELARAIANKENPLTARVIVNRVWAHHFGAGLVRSPGDFGVKGERPTHPELLDWLASRFVEGGWSLKQLHRLMMLSSVYQQGSDTDVALVQRDPENRLLAHANRRRLDYEAMRDSVLAVADQLDRTIGGRPVEITARPFPKRRTIYAFIDRQNLPGVFRMFDFASPDTTSPQRFVTTVPQQALFMMNSPFLIEQSKATAAHTQPANTPPALDDVNRLYRKVLGRDAEKTEVDASLDFLAKQASIADDGGAQAAGGGSLTPWEKLAQVLLATNEFVFVD